MRRNDLFRHRLNRFLTLIATAGLSVWVNPALAADTRSPEVQFVSPSSSQSVAAGQIVTLRANVVDDVGVRDVIFKINGAAVCATMTAPPFQCNWQVPANAASRYYFEIRAHDTSANNSDAGMYINVSGSAQPTPVPTATPVATPAPTPVPTPPPGVVDRQSPEVQFQTVQQAAAGQVIVLKANVIDNVAVRDVSIRIDGVQVCATMTAPPFQCNWQVPASGASRYYLTIRAHDTSGNNSDAGMYISVSGSVPSPNPTPTPAPSPRPTPVPTPAPGVNDYQSPAIDFTSPSNNSTVAPGQAVVLKASVVDNVAVRDVTFRIDGVQVCAVMTAPPFECNWQVPANAASSYFFTIRAHDSSGNNSDAGRYIYVNGSSSPNPTPTPQPTPPPSSGGGNNDVTAQKPSGLIRILPLGDSITEQGGTRGYRYYLYNSLRNDGTTFDFIGNNAGTNSLGYDGNNEGHTGWRAGQIRDALPGWLASYPVRPDVVLLHIGTNDLTQLRTAQNTANHVEAIIGILRSNNPNVQIVLAKILPNSTPGADVDGYNALLGPLAARLTTSQSPIKLVDMNTGYPLSYTDGTHPNETGAAEMGRRWYQALREFWRY